MPADQPIGIYCNVNGEPRPLDPNHAGTHIDRLYRAAWALCGNREDAEDLVQETYARVLARPRLLVSDDDLGYLLRALKNTFLGQLRKRKRQPRGETLDPSTEPVDARGHMLPQRQAELTEVYAAIAALPEPYRLAITAVDVTGLSYQQAAKALRERPGTVRSRVFRARHRVSDALAEGSYSEVGPATTLAW